jgi:hypothetical protein
MKEVELADNLKTALRNLPNKLRPKDADIGAIAVLLAQHPAMSRWWPSDRNMDFRGLNPP